MMDMRRAKIIVNDPTRVGWNRWWSRRIKLIASVNAVRAKPNRTCYFFDSINQSISKNMKFITLRRKFNNKFQFAKFHMLILWTMYLFKWYTSCREFCFYWGKKTTKNFHFHQNKAQLLRFCDYFSYFFFFFWAHHVFHIIRVKCNEKSNDWKCNFELLLFEKYLLKKKKVIMK